MAPSSFAVKKAEVKWLCILSSFVVSDSFVESSLSSLVVNLPNFLDTSSVGLDFFEANGESFFNSFFPKSVIGDLLLPLLSCTSPAESVRVGFGWVLGCATGVCFSWC